MLFGDLKNIDGNLYIGGCDAKALAKKYGTPLYVFDAERAVKTAKAYCRILEKEYGNFIVCYASKTFCCTGVYGFLTPLGLGADVASGGELYTALKGGVSSNKIFFHGNNKTDGEIRYALENNIGCFVVDSERELNKIGELAQKPQNIIVRVNPGVEAHTHRFIQTAAPDSKFGFSIADGTASEFIKKAVRAKNIAFKGIACHIGSQIFETEAFELAIEKMTDFIADLSKDGIPVEWLDLGGGFGIRYIPEDKPLTPEQYMTNTARALKKAVEKRKLAPPMLIVEPGRSIAGEAGVTLYTVGAIKRIKGLKTYAAVDGGMFDNPRVSLYDASYTAVVVDKLDAHADCKYTIAGKCCESGDIILRDCMLPELKDGDILCVMSTGAYHYSMASNYNRNAVPPVVAVQGGKACYMVKPQTYEDIARNDVSNIVFEDLL